MQPIRIALLTDEFVIEKPNAGGLGYYLSRMAIALNEAGHEVEIFALQFKL